MDTNQLLQRWATQSLDEIEEQIVRGEDQETVAQLLGPDTVAQIQGISFAPVMAGPREEVVLIPGIMGSNLSSIRGVTSLLWINPLMFLKGNARYLRLNADGTDDECPEVECVPVGLEKLTYLKIALLLNRQASLHEFPYDWRRPIEYNADILHHSIERWAGGDPTRRFTLVAHSMGGLVSRTYMARHPESAKQRIKRLIMHGTPNYGATNAIENIVNGNSMMATVDQLNQANAMRDLVYNLPSVYQLLPAPRSCFPVDREYPVDFDLYDASNWQMPSVQQKYLDGARQLYNLLDAADPQIPTSIIAGCNIDTLVHMGKEPSENSLGLQAIRIAEGSDSGDGTVPLWSAVLPGADVYYIQEVHRNLPNNGQVIQATMDLITSGTCSLPTSIPPRKGLIFDVTVPLPPEVQAEDLRSKIETGTASDQDLEKLYFAL